MGLIITSLDQLPEFWRAQAVEAVRIRMNLVRGHAVAHRTSDNRAVKAKPAPARRPRPAARRPSWWL